MLRAAFIIFCDSTEISLTHSFELIRPHVQTSPVLVSSPHSGRIYPPAFLAQSALDMAAIRSSEDAFVDRLVACAPKLGAPLLLAHVPRAYIDLNRGHDELDPAVIHGARRSDGNPRIASGLGVVPRVVSGGRAIYSGKLSFAEAEARIAAHWHPYHTALRALMNETISRFGYAILLDMHSMPTEAAQMQRPHQPEIVLGDRHGASASGAVVAQIESAFTAQGLRVMRNTPFAGAYIAQHYGRPFAGAHVVQIEMSRGLYMDEAQILPLAGFAGFAAKIESVIARLIGKYAAPSALAAE
jgi:N-formylglutamate amidohydrolase